jgi:hypothetical protein
MLGRGFQALGLLFNLLVKSRYFVAFPCNDFQPGLRSCLLSTHFPSSRPFIIHFSLFVLRLFYLILDERHSKLGMMGIDSPTARFTPPASTSTAYDAVISLYQAHDISIAFCQQI